MTQPRYLKALLYPDGSLSARSTLIPPEATWRALGAVQQAGESLTFVRVDVARVSWTALVPTRVLVDGVGPVIVALAPQLPLGSEPLSGWPLFS